MAGRMAALVLLTAMTQSAFAQSQPQGQPIPSSFTVVTGAKMTGFSIRASGGQCIARMKFQSTDGRSGPAEWTFTATADGNLTRCTQGRWRELIPNGQSGAMSNDIVLAGGKAYWARR